MSDLKDLVAKTNARVDAGIYQKIPDGTFHVAQDWSGGAVNAQYYLPEGTDVSVLGFWNPSVTPVGNDLFVLAGAEKPALAHAFINFMLDPENAQQNFEYVGYQPATKKLTVQDLIDAELVPENLRNTIVTEKEIKDGLYQYALDTPTQTKWEDAWSTFKAGEVHAVTALVRERRAARGRRLPVGRVHAPGSAWMIVFFLVPFYAVAAVAFGRIDPIFGTASPEEPPAVGLHGGVEHARRGLHRAAPDVYLAHVPVRRPRARPVRRDRVPGGVLRLTSGRPHQGPPPRAAHPPVLGQLPVADARLDRAAPARGMGERRARRARHLRRAAVVAQREPDGGRDRPRVRLPAVLHPAAVRQPRPARPAPDRSGARLSARPRRCSGG